MTIVPSALASPTAASLSQLPASKSAMAQRAAAFGFPTSPGGRCRATRVGVVAKSSWIVTSAFGYHERYRTKQDIVVGVNEYVEDEAEVEEILSVDPESERAQVERLRAFKGNRDQELTQRRLHELQDAARGDANLLPPIRQALKDHASVGEVCGALRDVFGEYQPEI